MKMVIDALIFVFTILIVYFLYAYKKIHNYFEKNEVKYLPGLPIFGNFCKSRLMRSHFADDLDEVYRAFPEEKYVGFIADQTPAILIRDPDLMKKIIVKDFDHFVDHVPIFSEDVEPLLGSSLIMMKGNKWRDMRTILSPTFTGFKLKQIMPYMAELSETTVKYLKDHQNEDLDVRDVIDKYTNDVITAFVFGLQVNSVKEKDNQFYKLSQSLFHFNFLRNLHFLLAAMFPRLCKILHINVLPVNKTQEFRDLVSSLMHYQENTNLEQSDFIQMLIKAKEKWSEHDLTSQAFFYFITGFESSAVSLVFCLHELALNPHVQEKMYQEVQQFKKKKENLTYANIQELKYLDCVVNELFRKWTVALFMDRTCTKSYELPPPRDGGKPYHVKLGDIVLSLVNSVHMDPDYIPDPYIPASLFKSFYSQVKPGNIVLSLVNSMHMDPDYIPDPYIPASLFKSFYSQVKPGNIVLSLVNSVHMDPDYISDPYIPASLFKSFYSQVKPGNIVLSLVNSVHMDPDYIPDPYIPASLFKSFYSQVKPGNIVLSLVNSVHMDPDYFPDLYIPASLFKSFYSQVKPGDIVLSVVNSVHMDPDHFPDPDKFDPERFSAENKHKIKPFTYMPFGMGPRICIGARFVLLELKVLLYHLALNFQIQKCAKTTDSIQLQPIFFGTDFRAKGGSWVRFKARNTQEL